MLGVFTLVVDKLRETNEDALETIRSRRAHDTFDHYSGVGGVIADEARRRALIDVVTLLDDDSLTELADLNEQFRRLA